MFTTLRYAVRSLAKSPGYTLIALTTLGLGIGVNTSMFSVVGTVLLRSAPYPHSDRLVQIAGVTRNGEMREFSDQEIREIVPQAAGFSSLTAVGRASFSMVEPGRPAERISGVTVGGTMMETFGTAPLLGRAFLPEEYTPGKNQVVLLNEAFWQNRFGGDRNVIGRTMRLDGEAVTVIGVMPESFAYRNFWGNVALWRPLNFSKDQSSNRGYRAFLLIGRMKEGISRDAITAQLAPLAITQQKAFPQDYGDLRYKVMSLPEASMDDVGRGISWMLLGLSGFVLLIACANLANLQLARATASIREFAIRAALGASRSRLITHQLIECLVLSLTGGLLGVVVAKGFNRLLEGAIFIDGVPGLNIPIDGWILLVTLVVSVATGVIFGIVPALYASRTNLVTSLKSQSRGATSDRAHHRMRHALIVGEVALALVLLGGAAIVNRGFSQFLVHPTGWDTAQVLTGTITLPESRFDSGEKRIAFFDKLTTQIGALPGVDHVALASSLPLFNYTSEREVYIDAPSSGQGPSPVASHTMVTSDFFATLGIRILEGHTFPPELKASGPAYILVSDSLARHFWPNQSAVGKRLGAADNNQTAWREIIGVVSDVDTAASVGKAPTKLTVYRPLVQEPWSYINLVVRTAHPETMVESVRRAVTAIDPDLPVDQLGSIRQFVDRTQHNFGVVGQLLLGFAALGLVLASVGLYGVISNIVAQRATEFGIRLALGAQPRDVLTRVLKRGMFLSAIGLVVGAIGTYGLGRFLSSIMPQLVHPDPWALTGVSGLLLGVTFIACWFPARRATRVDPMVALRAE